MQASGTHSSRLLDYLDIAINNTKGGRMLNHIGVYYFYLRAEEYSDMIDAVFQPFLSDGMKGSTVPGRLNLSFESSLTDSSDSRTSTSLQSKKERRNESKISSMDDSVNEEMNKAISAISQESKAIAEEMKRSNDLEEVKLKIDIAKALGDADMLRKLLADIQTSN